MATVPANEINFRIHKFQTLMQQSGLDSVFLMQGADLYYYAGIFQQGVLWIPAYGEAIFFVRRNLEDARKFSPLANLEPIKNARQISQFLAQKKLAVGKKAGIEADVLPVQQYEMLQEMFPEMQFVNCSTMIREQRSVKSDWEIAILRQGAAIMDQVFAELLAQIHVGMTELEIAARIEYLLRLREHQGFVRVRSMYPEFHYGSALAGANSAVPSFFDSAAGGRGLGPALPKGASRKPLMSGEPLMLDYVGCWKGYCVDATVICVGGTLPAHLLAAHQVALEMIAYIEKHAVPGAGCQELYLHTVAMAQQAGLAQHFMGYGENQVKFVGHGVGIELNELPVLAKGSQAQLAPNMVLAIEPKFIFPDFGMVGTESTYLATAAGLQRLHTFPTEIVALA